MDADEKPSDATRNKTADDAADSEYFANLPLVKRCAVSECDRPGTEEYHVCPTLIVDPEEEQKWPVVRFCKLHMQEIMSE